MNPFFETFRQNVSSYAFGGKRWECLSAFRGYSLMKGVLLRKDGHSHPPAQIEVLTGEATWCLECPRVWARVNWLCPTSRQKNQNLSDWHRYRDNELCWCYPPTWIKVLDRVDTCDKAISAAEFMVESVRVLLNYHFTAYTLGLADWQKEWDFAPHGYTKRDVRRIQ